MTALLSAGAAAQMPAAAAASHQINFVLHCPGGMSWDNILHICH